MYVPENPLTPDGPPTPQGPLTPQGPPAGPEGAGRKRRQIAETMGLDQLAKYFGTETKSLEDLSVGSVKTIQLDTVCT